MKIINVLISIIIYSTFAYEFCAKGFINEKGECQKCISGYYCPDGANKYKCPMEHFQVNGRKNVMNVDVIIVSKQMYDSSFYIPGAMGLLWGVGWNGVAPLPSAD